MTSLSHIVDLGCEQSLVLTAILRAHLACAARCSIRPALWRENGPAWQWGEVDRCNIVSGSFFDTVPEGADGHLMRIDIQD